MTFLRLLMLSVPLFFTACSHEYVRPENYKNPLISIDTEFGSIEAELYEDKVPNTVSHIINLTESDFYKEMLFHSIMPGLYVVGGCPHTKIGATGKPGTGDPGYLINEEIRNDLSHDSKGILSLLKRREPGTSGCQFLILLGKVPILDGQQTVFGKVTKGQEVLDLIANMGSRNGQPKREISFSIKLLRKNDIEYKVIKNN